MQELILIRLTGEDKPGLVAGITAVLAEYDVSILDIGQAVIHDTLSLGILIRIPAASESSPIIKDVLFAAHELGITVSFTPITAERYAGWVAAQGKDRHIVTLLSREFSARQVAAITAVIAENGLNIDVVTRLSGRFQLDAQPDGQRACVEFSVRGTPRDPAAMRSAFLSIASTQNVDIAFQEDNAFRRNRRLIAFDMDSTLVQAEGIDEMARLLGVGEEVSRVTAAAMRGEIDFRESLRRRLSCCRGLEETALHALAENIPLTDGAERLIANLKRFGYKIAIISGGFTYFGRRLQERLGIDYVYANELEIVDGRLTGQLRGEIVDGARKAAALREIAEKERISLQQAIAVGDGANDLPMLTIAGLGIAFHAKPVVREGARQSISTFGLDSILYLIGLRDRDIVA